MADNSVGGLSGLAIKRPVFISMVMVLLVVLGIFSFNRLPIDQFPNVDIPVAVVQTVYPGASPETVEREVTRRMEEAFNPVEGVDRITSVSLEGVSVVTVEFDLGRDVDQATADIRTKIEGIRRNLPADIESPIVQKFDPAAEPIISLGLASTTMSIPQLTVFADEDIRRSLESVSGVGEVRLTGGLEREVRVFLQPDRMLAVGVSVPEIMGALQRQNLEVPAGRIEQGSAERLVRVVGRITDASQFGEVFIADRGGRPIRLKDVARVEEGTEEERSVALLNGTRAVSIDILKVSGANTVQVADGVAEAVEKLRPTLPKGVELTVIRDNAVWIRNSVDDVIHELILGAILTILVVMLFLNDWKATAITSLALPVSVISAFILLAALGFTINLLTLMALSLSIGILIDDAIVVIENIVRHREHGEDHFTAASRGTREIVLAVMATTFSIIAVFVPVAFMRGIIGRFFYEFGLTVAWAVLVSLFVSFTLTPMLAAWWGVEPHQGIGWKPLTNLVGRFNSWFDRQANKYRGVVKWALGRRKTTLAIAAAAFVAAFMLFPFIGGGFMPATDNSEFVVVFETPEGSSLSYTRDKADQIGNAVREIDGVEYTYTTIGSGATGTVTDGQIYVKLVPSHDRDLNQREVMVVAREKISPIFGAITAVLESGGMGGPVAPLQVQVRGPDIATLQKLANELKTEMASIPGIVDVKSSMGEPRPEFTIEVNRDLANEVGVDIGSVAATVRPLMAGQTATRWEDASGEEREVVVQVEPGLRQTVEQLASLPVATARRSETGASAIVGLGQIARIQESTAPAQIDRVGLQRVATVSASTTPDFSISEASAAIREKEAAMTKPPGYQITLGGETEELEETGGYVMETLLLAVILIFLILASQFESFTQPFAIMTTLPLSLVGVLLALLVTNDTLNMMSMIGIIMLMGLVTKNAILLVDNANEKRSHGMERTAALIEAGAVRLRPIIMTTAAMIFGMLPIAMSMGEGGGFRAPMARAVIGGLITSTLLTLVVIPVVYTYMDDIGSFFKRKLVSEEKQQELREEQRHAGLEPEPAYGD
jgi:hydrophobic/amphiphilic exporter-1 (mainly G- bacteria), HAE1 family